MDFRTIYTKSIRFHSPTGGKFVPEYAPVFDKQTHHMSLKVKNRINAYEMIQSHRDSVDLHVLLARFKNGDTEALNRAQGFFGDFVGLPSSIAEAVGTLESGKSLFESLPVEVKNQFNNNYFEFISSFDTDKFKNIFFKNVNNDIISNIEVPASDTGTPDSPSDPVPVKTESEVL